MVTKSGTDYTRDVDTYLADFQRVTGRELEVLDPESPEGISFCESYDILQSPTLIALSVDGYEQNRWVGTPLPTINEVSYYS